MNAPCYKCESRHPGCHDKCGGYQEWAVAEKTKKQQLQQDTGLSECDFFHISNVVKTKRRYNL